MANYKKIFMKALDGYKLKYRDNGEDAVFIQFGGDNMKEIQIGVFFAENNEPVVQFCCFPIASFKNKELEGLVVCNELNAEYRWFKFYLDKDKDVICLSDALLDEDSAGEECIDRLQRLVRIVDEVYPRFMRALYA